MLFAYNMLCDSRLADLETLRSRFPYIAFAVLIFGPLGLGTLVYTMTGLIPREETEIVESLAVKIMYSPELRKYVEAGGRFSPLTGRYVGEIGDFIRVEWIMSEGEVNVVLGNETVGIFDADELRTNVEILDQTLMGLPIKIAVAICKIPILHQETVPSSIRGDVLRLMEDQPFTRWVDKEGFRYTITNIMPINPLTFRDPTIKGVLVDMSVEDLIVKYRLFFNEPYILANTTIPKDLEVSEQERKHYGIHLVYLYEGGTTMVSYSHLESENASISSLWKELDITEDLKEIILAMMKEEKVLARLLETTGCEIKKITGSQYNPEVPPPPFAFSERRASVIVICENFGGYGIKVAIDLEANIIDEIWLCEESIMAEMLSNY